MQSKPRVGTFAKRALVLALSLHNHAQIDTFIHTHTDLVEVVIAELCKKFQTALESICADKQELHAQISYGNYYFIGQAAQPAANPVQQPVPSNAGQQPPPSSSLLRAAQANFSLSATSAHGNGSANNHNLVLSASGTHVLAGAGTESAAFVAVDAFVKCLKFVDLLVSVCTSMQGKRSRPILFLLNG
jgi:hypothetical protein